MNQPNGKPIRAVLNRSQIFAATEIPRLGFGSSDLVHRPAPGVLYAESITRVFKAACGCHVERPGELGSPCDVCMIALLEARDIGDPRLADLAMEQLPYLVTPCHRHSVICSAPLCGVGLCASHFGSDQDGNPYCPPHFREVEEARTQQELVAMHGRAYTALKNLHNSFYFDKP